MFLEIAMGISAGSSILQGISGSKGAKHIARAERDIANMQYEYNKKEVNRAFKQNLESLMKDYANQRLNAVTEAETMLANININTGNKSNVEKDSFEHDIKDKASKEIADNMTSMVINQVNDISDLGLMKSSQQYQVDLNYGSAISRINQAKIEATRKAGFNILNGITTLGGLGIESYLKYKPTGTTSTNNETAFKQEEDKYFTNGIIDFEY